MQKVYSGEYQSTEQELDMQTHIKSQAILGKVSQSRYEQALQSLLSKVSNFMQGIQKDSPAYDFVDRVYDSVVFWAEPEKYVIKNNSSNKDEKINTLIPIQESKDSLLSALLNKSQNISQELTQLQSNLKIYEGYLQNISSSFLPFFATFESEFSQSEMQEIVDELAAIKAYNNHKAHNITLADGSLVSWEYDDNGQINIKINNFDINIALENADKLLTEMENFKTLLEVFKNRENLENSSSLNGANLNENSTFSLQISANFSENFAENSQNATQNSSNSSFKMLVEAQPITSIIVSKNANGDTIEGMWHPMATSKGAQGYTEYLASLEASNSRVSSTPSKAEFDKAVQSINALMKEVRDFVRDEQGESQLSVDLAYLQNTHTSLFEGLLSQTQWEAGDDTYENMWMGFKVFFDYASDKIGGLPQSEINKNIATIQSYLVATSPSKRASTNTLKFSLSSENLSKNLQTNLNMTNDELLKTLLNMDV